MIWSFANVDLVYVAIDNLDAPLMANLAPTGELQLPYMCPGPHTYYAVATSATGERVVGERRSERPERPRSAAGNQLQRTRTLVQKLVRTEASP